MQGVSVDIFEFKGVSFLVMADRFSGFPFIAKLSRTSTEAVCEIMLGWFCDYGLPCTIKSDNGPQFRGPFEKFCEELNINHETSSPYNPRSNGLAEATVKAMKSLLDKLNGQIDGRAFRLALLTWRNTPRADGFSPAAGFFGRHQRTLLPDARNPNVNVAEFIVARQTADEKAVSRAGGKTLQPLAVGTKVHYQHPIDLNWCVGATIKNILPNGRSYLIETPSGTFRRNRKLLRKAIENPPLHHISNEEISIPKLPVPDQKLRRSKGSEPTRRSERLRRRVTFRE